MQTLDAVPAVDAVPAPERAHLPRGQAQEHPVGGIRLWTTGALGRRANALAGGEEVLMLSHTPYETMTWTSRDGNTDW